MKNGSALALMGLLLKMAVALGAGPLDCSQILREIGAQAASKGGYSMTGDKKDSSQRCEGVYTEYQSLPLIDFVVVDLRATQPVVPIKNDTVIRLAVPAGLLSGGEAVRVSAVPSGLTSTYRMDAQISSGSSLKWPAAEHLAGQFRNTGELWIHGSMMLGENKVYLPVYLHDESGLTAAPVSNDNSAQLTLLLAHPSSKVWFRSVQCAATNQCERASLTFQQATLTGARIAAIPVSGTSTGLSKITIIVEPNSLPRTEDNLFLSMRIP